MKFIKVFLFIYIFLTFLKVFTAEINTQREEDPTICFRVNPTVENTFSGEDYHLNWYRNKYAWLKEGKNWEIIHGNGSMLLLYGYRGTIKIWWITSSGLILYGLYSLRRFNK